MPDNSEYSPGAAGYAEADAILASMAFPVVVVDPSDEISYLNGAAEQFFERGAHRLIGHKLNKILPSDSPVIDLVRNVRDGGISIFEYGIDLELPRGGGRSLMISGSPVGLDGGSVTLSFHQQLAARSLERQHEYRQAARSVTAMASMLAHEVKNPLSGIRGAAQLLERSVSGSDQSLARLIQDETDRVCGLVDRMDVFGDTDFLVRKPVNIHEVLQRVIDSASVGFAQDVEFSKEFDPSLPPVPGNRDLLVQIFLNLVKNASEAINPETGRIILRTAFRRGVSPMLPGGEGRVHLPLCVSVIDNGPGIPDIVAGNLFDPFVSTKLNGTGLGLAFVAKAVDEHGGIIEFDTGPDGTEFRVFLPIGGTIEETEE